uniref:zinc finger protein 583 n=1 Tax=Ciona intestinalis TaxID=7719 RepID=UPI000180BD84|nr:zinc finger protein 583 [Ciona intestinalis]|eukprot:XP_026690314.1 zinc finger protein 583 [Ciona intestinalis]
MNMLDDKDTATSISLLILQELKLIRQDMKNELTKLRHAFCNKYKNNEKGCGLLVGNGLELVSANERNSKEIGLLENGPLNSEESSRKSSNEQSLNAPETIEQNAQHMCDELDIKHEILQDISENSCNDEEYSDTTVGNMFKSFEPSPGTDTDSNDIDIYIASSNTESISNEDTELNMGKNAVVPFTLPIVTTTYQPSKENFIIHTENALSAEKTSKEFEHKNCENQQNFSFGSKLKSAGLNEEKFKEISLFESSSINRDAELQIACVYGNLKPNTSMATSSNAKCISDMKSDSNLDTVSNFNQDLNIEPNAMMATQKKQNRELSKKNVRRKFIQDTPNTAKVTEEFGSQFRPFCYDQNTNDSELSSLSMQYYYDNFNAKNSLEDFRNVITAIDSEHKKVRPQCKQCGKDFDSYYKKRRHIALTHHSKPKFVCSYCKQVFICKPHLTVHVRRKHTGEKPFSCLNCGKKFTCISDCNQHMKSLKNCH